MKNREPFIVTGKNSIFVAEINVCDEPYCADNTGTLDSSDAVSLALNDCSDRGGGCVFMPAGRYLIKSTVHVPSFVTLLGESGKTVILAKPESTLEKNGILFDIGGSAGVRGLTVYYPEQKLDCVKPYSYTFYTDGIGDRYMLASVTDCIVLNGYNGIGACVYENNAHEMFTIDNVRGTFLNVGAEVYNQADVGTWKSLSVSPEHWATADAEFDPPSYDEIRAYTKKHTTGLVLGDLEWTEFADVSITGCRLGVHVVKGKRIEFAGSLFDCTVSDCAGGILCDSIDERWGMVIAKSCVSGDVFAVRNLTGGIVKMCGCTVTGEIDGTGDIVADDTYIDDCTVDYKKYHSVPNPVFYCAEQPDSDCDATEYIQTLLDKARVSGGIVYLPSGIYNLRGRIHVPAGVQLTGSSMSPVRPTYLRRGTVLCFICDESDTLPRIELERNAGVEGMCIICSDNVPGCLRHTPYMIRGLEDGVYVENISIAAASHGVDFSGCSGHFIKKLVTLCYDDAMKLGGRDGHVEGCLQNGSVMYRAGYIGGRLKEADIFNELFDPLTRRMTKYIITDGADGEVILNTFAYGVSSFVSVGNSRNVLLVNIGADNIGEDSPQLVCDNSDMTAVNVMRYNGHSYDHRGGSMRLYNRLTICLKDEKTAVIGLANKKLLDFDAAEMYD